MSIQFDIAKQIIAETYDDNQDNFLTTCSCLSARRAYKIRPVVPVVVILSA